MFYSALVQWQSFRWRCGALALVILTLSAVVACTNSDSIAGPPMEAEFDLPVSDVDFDPLAPAWVRGDVLRSGRSRYPLEPGVTEFVIGPRGIYYVAKGRFWFTDGNTTELVAADANSLAVSGDRTRLGLLDFTHSSRDGFGTAAAEPVVFNLVTGEQLVRHESTVAAGSDLASTYGEERPRFVGFDVDNTAFVGGIGGRASRVEKDGSLTTLPYDGEGSTLPGLPGRLGTPVQLEHLGQRRLVLATVESQSHRQVTPGWRSPDGTLLLDEASDHGGWYDASTGRRLRINTGLPQFQLGGWTGGSNWYGLSYRVNFDEGLDEGPAELVECSRATRTCRVLDSFSIDFSEQDFTFGIGPP